MISALHDNIIAIDNILLEFGLGRIPITQTCSKDTEHVEVRILEGQVKNYRTVLSTEARRLDLPQAHTSGNYSGVDLGDNFYIADTVFRFKVQELPRLRLLLESALHHNDKYTFFNADGNAICCTEYGT